MDLTRLALLVLDFSRVERVTLHPDGKRPETDAEHTLMLIYVACSLATLHPEWGLDVGKLAQLAAVHDLPEVHVGDTNSYGFSAGTEAAREARAAKKDREAGALQRLLVEHVGNPWLCASLIEYEAQLSPEARLLRYLDKVLPRVLNALNGCVVVKQWEGETLDTYREKNRRQMAELSAEYPEWPDIGLILWEACILAEQAWSMTTPYSTYHILREGQAICGAGMPDQWKDGFSGLTIAEAWAEMPGGLRLCPGCKAEMRP